MPAAALPIDQTFTSFEAAGGTTVSRTLHPSGLRILTETVPGSQSATVGFWIPAGSRDEAEGAYGSTHFLEHLLFKGTPTRTALDIAIAFDAVGGDHNAVTAKEYTCYYGKVRDRDLSMAVDVLSDMMAAALIDRAEFELERGVILEELAMADDDPADVAGERFAEAVYGTHPLGRPIGGSPESIRAVSRDRVYGHFQEHYRPAELVVTAAGAVDHAALVEAVVTGLARYGWDLGSAGAPRPRRASAPAVVEGRIPVTAVTRKLEQVSLVLGTAGLTAADAERPTLAVLSNVLGGGMSSRLFQEVRERRGLAYSVYSYTPAYSDAGALAMAASCTPKKVGDVLRVMSDEFVRLGEAPIEDAELGRAVGQLSGSAALALEDSDTRMNRLARAELTTGEFVDLDTSSERLAAVTPAMVQSLAARLVAQDRVVVGVGPVKESTLVP